MSKLFTKAESINAYGRPIIIYRSINARVMIELQYPLNGEYWWVKMKKQDGPGRDGALNIPDDECKTLAAIFNEIDKDNRKLSSHILKKD